MICHTMSRKMSTSNLDFMGNVVYVVFISDMQYPGAKDALACHVQRQDLMTNVWLADPRPTCRFRSLRMGLWLVIQRIAFKEVLSMDQDRQYLVGKL